MRTYNLYCVCDVIYEGQVNEEVTVPPNLNLHVRWQLYGFYGEKKVMLRLDLRAVERCAMYFSHKLTGNVT